MASIINKLLGKGHDEAKSAETDANVHHASSNPADGTHSTTQGHPHNSLGTTNDNTQGTAHSESMAQRLTSDFGGAKTGDFGGATGNVRTTATGGIGGVGSTIGSAREGYSDDNNGVGAASGYRQGESTGQQAKDALASERASHISSQERSSGTGAAGLSGDQYKYGSESTGQRVGEGLSSATGQHSHEGHHHHHHHQQQSGEGQYSSESTTGSTGQYSSGGMTGSTGQYTSGMTSGSNYGQQTGRTETFGGGGFDGVGEGYNDSSMGAGVSADIGGASKLEGEELGSFRGEQGFSQGGNEDSANRR